jgi:aspartyl-tRNA(Asn)/glutamyl-tRNA(Gln) amidotransferase subunit C
MPAKIDRAAIDHVAKLASLSLTDAEAERLAFELGAIVRYVEELASIDTSNVAPTATVQLARAEWRGDAVEPCLSHEEALAGATRATDGGFAVPAFVEGQTNKGAS